MSGTVFNSHPLFNSQGSLQCHQNQSSDERHLLVFMPPPTLNRTDLYTKQDVTQMMVCDF